MSHDNDTENERVILQQRNNNVGPFEVGDSGCSLDGVESKLGSAGRGRCVVQAEKPSIMDTPMPDAGTPAQTPVPPAAPAPEPRHFALDLLQRQDFAQRRDARNFLEQYLWLGCRMGGMAGFVGVCVGVSVRASRARAGAGCVCASGRCACVCVCARVGAWRVSVCARVGAWSVSVCASAGPKCVCVCVCVCVSVCGCCVDFV